jgi:hypothetical protein
MESKPKKVDKQNEVFSGALYHPWVVRSIEGVI